MENSTNTQLSAFFMELIDKIIAAYIELTTRVNLHKIRSITSSLATLLSVTLIMVAFAITCWWCILVLLFIGLQTLNLPLGIIVLLLLALNLIGLLVSIMLFFSFKNKLKLINN